MKKYSVITLMSVLIVAGPVAGQETNEPEHEIIVSASRDYRQAYQIPANVTVLTASDIEEAGSIVILDALKNLNGIILRTTSGDMSQGQVDIRGFGENSHGRVLVLIDGRKLNRPDMAGINWTQIPVQAIERVEILRGSQTTLYGDHAIGGVINIITKKGTPTPEYSISTLGGSDGLNVQRMGVLGTAGALSYAANAERNQSSGYRDRSAYLAGGGNINLNYDINERNTLRLALAYNTIDYQLPGYLSKEQMEADPRQSFFPDDKAENDYYNADIGLKSLFGGLMEFEINTFYGRKDITSDITSWSSFSDFTIDTYGATPRVLFHNNLFNCENTFLIGFDGYQDALDLDRYLDAAHSINTTTAKIKKRTLGGYAKNEFSISKDLLFELGARIEEAKYDADMPSSNIDDSTHHTANAFDAALIYTLAKQSKVFARVGTAYRFPFIDEQISYIGFGTDGMYQNLDMEKGQNYEIGTDLSVLENLHMGLTLFLLDIKDQIAWNNATYKNDNLDDTRHMGAEASAVYSFADLYKITTSYTYTQTEFTKGEFDGNDVPLVPNHKVSVDGTWFLPFNLSANAGCTYISKQYLGGDNANTSEKLSDYTIVDLALRYRPEFIKSVDIEAFARIENIFNEKYASVGYRGWTEDAYYPSPDRTFKVGIACRF